MRLKDIALLLPPLKRLDQQRKRLRQERDRLKTQLGEVQSELSAMSQENSRLREQPSAPGQTLRLLAYMDRYGVELVLDVGANTGQFAESLRQVGFGGMIVSFEPQSGAFKALQVKCNRDDSWFCHRLALGDTDGQAMINISENSVSSSLLPVCKWTVEAERSIAYRDQEAVLVRRLDAVVPELTDAKSIFLKVDAQGFESRVIEGARTIIDRFAMVQLEVAWTPSYEGQAELGVMVGLMNGLGFQPIQVDPAWTDSAGIIREIDVVFARPTKAATQSTSA